jgi:peroxin-3
MIMEEVDAAVKEVFGPINPREDITFERLSSLVVEVRKKVEGETEEARRYTIPFPLHLAELT